MPNPDQIERFRRFNRFYTNYLGLLGNALYDTPVNLAEARILYELDSAPGIPAKNLMDKLGLDKGYLSRLLKRLAHNGLISKTRSRGDARVQELRLSARGATLMRELHAKASDQAARAMAGLSGKDRARLLDAMAAIETILCQ